MSKLTTGQTLNIGLLNNALGEERLKDVVKYVFSGLSRVHMGSYNGKPEPTLVVYVPHRIAEYELENITQACTQECIAVFDHENQTGTLVWDPAQTPTMGFDPAHFIHFEVN